MIGEFVEIADPKMPWAPWKIWVEHHWLDMSATAHTEAKRILDSGWMYKRRQNGN